MIDNQRVELPYEWHVIADKLGIKGYDKTLLSIHFDGAGSLYNELRATGNMTTDWLKVTDNARSSKYRLYRGKLEYIKSSGKALKAHVRERAKSDTKHRNYYLTYSHYYMHRLMAQAVYDKIGKSVDGLKIHHRLIDETATLKGNSLGYLVVLTDEEHSRLHYLLNAIIDYVEDYISGQINLFDIVD